MDVNFKKAFKYWIKNKKYITVFTISLITIIVAMIGIFNVVLSAVALEQEAKCDVEQHIHTDSCYNGDLVVCNKEAHVHDSNCYIVLLNENDINNLLVEIDDSDDKSLDSVLDDVITIGSSTRENTAN